MFIHLRLKTLPCMLAFCVCANAYSQRVVHDYGRVSMQGSIFESACSIDTKERDQSITMDDETIDGNTKSGMKSVSHLSIALINCNSYQNDDNRFVTTFDVPSKKGLFAVSGTLETQVKIIDSQGHIALPGQPLPDVSLSTDSQHLNYTLQLVGNNHASNASGTPAVLRLKVDYF